MIDVGSCIKLVFIRVRGQYEFGKIHTQFGYDGQDLDYGFYMDIKSMRVSYNPTELTRILHENKISILNEIIEICGKTLPHISTFITDRRRFIDDHMIADIFTLLLS